MPSVNVGDINVQYFVMGAGEPILLLHCTGGSNRQWYQLAEALREHFQVIAPDLCGYGGTTQWPGASPFNLASEADLVAALIDRIGKPVHLVGHSFGGAVALQAARRQPDCLKSLIVIEPAAFHLLRDGDEIDQSAFDEISEVAATIASAVNRGDYQNAMRRFVNYWSGGDAWAAMSHQQRTALAMRINKVALDFWATLNEQTRLNDFFEVMTPTLVLCGQLSPLPTQRICLQLARSLPDARLGTIEGAGHMMPVTHVDKIYPLVLGHTEAVRYPPAVLRSAENLPAGRAGLHAARQTR